MDSIGIYIHIPFCDSKCFYCDFTSFAFSDSSKSEKITLYMKALLSEIDLYGQELKEYSIKSIYFGGGTPSSIPEHYIASVINRLSELAEIEADCEITIEVNPGSVDKFKIDTYKLSGVNRISLGLQSTNNQLLKSIGRQHDFESFLESYKIIQSCGIDNISVDLIFGLPGQSMALLRDTLNEIIAIEPNHVSVYALKLEEGTHLYAAHEKGLLLLPDEELERAMYHEIIQRLEASGFYQYEISNFAKTGAESRHNLIYWENKAYLGLGLSAHSKMNSIRFSNTSLLNDYLSLVESNKKPLLEQEYIDAEEDLFETIMLGLRLNKGISKAEIEKRHKIDFEGRYFETLQKFEALKLISYDGDCLKLTLKGRDLSNQVFLGFMNE